MWEEREEGLRKYELVYDLAAGSIKKRKGSKQDVIVPLFYPLLRTAALMTSQRPTFSTGSHFF